MATKLTPQVWPCTVLVCQNCLDLKGQECHEPDCVFCFRGMDEVRYLLDKITICPIIDGKRIVLWGKDADADPTALRSRSVVAEREEAVRCSYVGKMGPCSLEAGHEGAHGAPEF